MWKWASWVPIIKSCQVAFKPVETIILEKVSAASFCKFLHQLSFDVCHEYQVTLFMQWDMFTVVVVTTNGFMEIDNIVASYVFSRK